MLRLGGEVRLGRAEISEIRASSLPRRSDLCQGVHSYA